MKKRDILISTALGLGYSPIAPGTVGSLGGCLTAVVIYQYTAIPEIILFFLIILFLFLGIESSGRMELSWGKDPSKVVIDEVVGMWMAMLMIPSGWGYVVAAFVLFRFFDIVKPFKIRKFEEMSSGWGIMMDDVIAGFYSNITIQVTSLIISLL